VVQYDLVSLFTKPRSVRFEDKLTSWKSSKSLKRFNNVRQNTSPKCSKSFFYEELGHHVNLFHAGFQWCMICILIQDSLLLCPLATDDLTGEGFPDAGEFRPMAKVGWVVSLPRFLGTSQVEPTYLKNMRKSKRIGVNFWKIFETTSLKRIDLINQLRSIHIWFGSFQLACTQDSSHQLQDETYLGSGPKFLVCICWRGSVCRCLWIELVSQVQYLFQSRHHVFHPT